MGGRGGSGSSMKRSMWRRWRTWMDEERRRREEEETVAVRGRRRRRQPRRRGAAATRREVPDDDVVQYLAAVNVAVDHLSRGSGGGAARAGVAVQLAMPCIEEELRHLMVHHATPIDPTGLSSRSAASRLSPWTI